MISYRTLICFNSRNSLKTLSGPVQFVVNITTNFESKPSPPRDTIDNGSRRPPAKPLDSNRSSQQRDLADILKFPRDQFVEVHAGRHQISFVVTAVPLDSV